MSKNCHYCEVTTSFYPSVGCLHCFTSGMVFFQPDVDVFIYLSWSSQAPFKLTRNEKALLGYSSFQILFTKHAGIYCWVTMSTSKVSGEVHLHMENATTYCLDHTSEMPHPLYWLRGMGNDSCVYTVLPTLLFFDNVYKNNCQVLHPEELRVYSWTVLSF